MGFNIADYEPVAERIPRFWEKHPSGAIETDLIHHDESTYIVRAILRDGEGRLIATGLAQETVGKGNVNTTSALENCETSAIGRALANGGWGAGKNRPSREEMAKAVGDLEASDIDSMKPRELNGALRQLGLDASGTEAEMRERLREAVAA